MSASPLRRIPRTVWVLGFVSLLMDVSSEMIHAVLPLFMVQVLAADVFWVGLIEGAAEAVALAAKVFSGVIAKLAGLTATECMGVLGLASSDGWTDLLKKDSVDRGVRINSNEDTIKIEINAPKGINRNASKFPCIFKK